MPETTEFSRIRLQKSLTALPSEALPPLPRKIAGVGPHEYRCLIQYFPVGREATRRRSRGNDRRLVRESLGVRANPQSLTTSATGELGTTVICVPSADFNYIHRGLTESI